MIRGKLHGQEGADLVRKVMGEEDSFKTRWMNPELIRRVVAFRLARGWKRVDLARFLSEKESVIADLENGKLVHDPKLAQKIRMRCGF